MALLRRRNQKLTSLLEVTTALTRELHIDSLLDLILHESTRTVDADRGSLFIMSRDGSELWSKIALGEQKMIRVAVGQGIAGTVAQTKQPLNIPDAYRDKRFNPEVDRLTGYMTHSILCVPMLGGRREVVGVIQALNHATGPFTRDDEELLMAFGAGAAAAIENASLYEEIERLFEGFVQASITAIESRDPSTAGHSGRVADLSVGLMCALERSSGPYRDLRFRPAEIRELRYAALLHDFGKVGVREHVLLKSEKLYPHELSVIEERFELARASAQREQLEEELALWRAASRSDAETRVQEVRARHAQKQAELDEMLDFVRRCNLPTVLQEGSFERLEDLAKISFQTSSGRTQQLLLPQEMRNLSIGRGSLNPDERREIESHVVHTYAFLSAIPWTRDLSRVPEIARGHHEKLNGGGYPKGVLASEIPLQTRMMTIADIYDALTAADRPYKKALPHTRALDILVMEAKVGAVDQPLLDVFIESKIAEQTLGCP
ncbi:MAG: GAF domain-containing protein [Deltaproteobacteria bacterium]|nr:GAF domain-containing protein [Deltaproteobacteria bacterium]